MHCVGPAARHLFFSSCRPCSNSRSPSQVHKISEIPCLNSILGLPIESDMMWSVRTGANGEKLKHMQRHMARSDVFLALFIPIAPSLASRAFLCALEKK